MGYVKKSFPGYNMGIVTMVKWKTSPKIEIGYPDYSML